MTSRDAQCTLCSVRRREPAEPQASAERRKPREARRGGRKANRREAERRAGRRDRGPGANPAWGAQPERARGSVLRWSVVRHGGFPGVAGAGLGRGLSDTTPAAMPAESSLTWPRGAREASAERLLGVASRPGPESGAAPSGACSGARVLPALQGRILRTGRHGSPTFDPVNW